jgi:hypothetical protein
MARVGQLCFEQGKIDVRWALDCARFAGETIAQGRVQLFGAQGVILKPQLQRGPDGVGPPAGRHVFLPGSEEGGTHRGRVFPATAAAIALLEIAEERFVLEGEREDRLERKPQALFGFDAQVIVDLEAPVAENFSRIEQVLRIKDFLDLAHHS